MIDFKAAANLAETGQDLPVEAMTQLVSSLLDGQVATNEEAIADVKAWLVALASKGETAAELFAAAAALRKHMTPIRHQFGGGEAANTPSWQQTLLDTCGTGGSGSGTFNISTATAIVVSAAGVPVAKHGNRRATSRSGSADVLAELGVAIESDREAVERCLSTLNICFCFAPTLHPAMRHVAAIRRSIDVPTMFNLLGPLCNPAGATHQLLGTGRPEKHRVMAEALSMLGTAGAFVVHGEDGQDEVTLDGATSVFQVFPDGRIKELTWTPASFGLLPAGREAMQAQHPEDSARIIREIFAGKQGPCRDIVVANAAAAFLLVGRVATLLEGVALAQQTLDSQTAANHLARFASYSSGTIPADGTIW